MKTLLKRIFGFKLHAHEKVKVAGGKGKSATNMFAKAHKHMVKAIDMLNEAQVENRRSILQLEHDNKQIDAEIKAHTKVADELKKFVPVVK
jgi:archaellum component FlaC